VTGYENLSHKSTGFKQECDYLWSLNSSQTDGAALQEVHQSEVSTKWQLVLYSWHPNILDPSRDWSVNSLLNSPHVHEAQDSYDTSDNK
jgi:hypothetical protein